MKYKNYYKILGLKSSKVTDDEIKSAYRKLAKKYHPDRNPGDLIAAEKFKDVNEAYQILIDETKKKKFNRVHFVYSLKDYLNVNNIKDRIDKAGASEFVEMFMGKPKEIFKKKTANSPINGENVEIQLGITLEEAYRGKNKTISFKGKDDKAKKITVKIPSGIVDGGKIRIKGHGKIGQNGGKVGDLLLKINILEHEKFRIEKNNLVLDLPLTPSEAALGCSIDLDGIDSRVTFDIPSGTASGDILNISGKGYFDENGNRGDLLAVAKIVVPREISDEERKLYEKLQEITEFKPRKG